MSWVTDYFDDANFGTKTTTLTQGVNTYYDKLFLEVFKKLVKCAQHGQKRPIPPGNGKTIEFFRYLELTDTVSSLTLTEEINPNAQIVYGQKQSASLVEYGGFAQLSSLLKKTHIDVGLKGVVELFAEQAARLVDNLCKRSLTNGAYPIIAKTAGLWDSDTTARYVGSVTTATSTTSIRDSACTTTNFGDANNDLNQCVIIFTGGKNKGFATSVSSYTASGGIIGLSPALPNSPAIGDTFVVQSPWLLATGSSSTDSLGYGVAAKARSIIKTYGGMPYSDGYYIGIIGPDEAYQLANDTKWVNVETYQGKGIYTGEIGKLAGIRWIEDTNPFYFPYDGTKPDYADTTKGVGATGANQTTAAGSSVATATFVLGQNAFGLSTFSDQTSEVNRPKIIVKEPGPGDTSNPLNRYGTVGWTIPLAVPSLNALHAVQIWTNSQASFATS